MAAVNSCAMEEPTVLEVAPSSRAELSTLSPGRGSNIPGRGGRGEGGREGEREGGR